MTTRTKIVLAVLAVPAIGVGWWLGSPLILDTTVDEAFPVVEQADDVTPETTSTATTTVATSDEDAAPADEPTTTAAQEASGPVALSIGDFRDADDFHQGSGTATVYELEDGSRFLRFEDFEVTNGPALRVYLVAHPDPTTNDQVTADYVDLGELKGNIGNQNYEIPADVDLDRYRSVVIWCEPFAVIFSVASLEA